MTNFNDLTSTYSNKSPHEINLCNEVEDVNSESYVSEAEATKFIEKMDYAFKNGSGLNLGEFHDEIGTYKLLNHPKVQAFFDTKFAEAKKNGYKFIDFLYLENNPSATVLLGPKQSITTAQAYKNFSNKVQYADEMIRAVEGSYEYFSKPGDINKLNQRLKFLTSMRDRGVKIMPIDDGVVAYNQEMKAFKESAGAKLKNGKMTQTEFNEGFDAIISKHTTLRNQSMANNITNTRSNSDAKSHFMGMYGNTHLVTVINQNPTVSQYLTTNYLNMQTPNSYQQVVTDILLLPDAKTEQDKGKLQLMKIMKQKTSSYINIDSN